MLLKSKYMLLALYCSILIINLISMSNKLVTCPYDEVHKVKESRFSIHIAKCRLNHLNEEKFTCPFNATHVIPVLEKAYHLSICADRAPLDRQLMADVLGKNNAFKGNTSVPSYTESPVVTGDEVWDDEYDLTPRICSKPAPPCGVFEPPALAQPKERRRLYQELHRLPTEIERTAVGDNKDHNLKTTQMNRQPKAPSQIETKKHQEFQSLGLGRGRPTQPSRIAANIFPSTTSQEPIVNGGGNYSTALISGMNNLGLGRGFPLSSATNSQMDDEFPALGFGRGITRSAKNGNR